MVMAHGIKQQWEETPIKINNSIINTKIKPKKTLTKTEKTTTGTRRIFSPQFKIQVLNSYRQDADCQGNQRATARKYGIHRRQIQKWLQMESSLRCTVKANMLATDTNTMALNLSSPRQCGYIRTESTSSITTPSSEISEEEEYVNVDEITDSEDSEEALDLSIKLKISNREVNFYGCQNNSCSDYVCRISPPLWYLPPCCYPYSWNCCLPSPPTPTSATVFVEKPLPRRQHLPLDFTNYPSYSRTGNLPMYKIHSY